MTAVALESRSRSATSRPVADTDHVDVGQPDKQLAHARRVGLQQGLLEFWMRKTHPDSSSPCPRPRTLDLPHPTLRSEEPLIHCQSTWLEYLRPDVLLWTEPGHGPAFWCSLENLHIEIQERPCNEPTGMLGFNSVLLNWHDTKNTLSVYRVDPKSDQARRIIVVDNESDHLLSQQVSSMPSVEVIEVASNLGFAAGMNIGMRAALAHPQSNVLLVNNDVFCCPGSLDLLLDALRTSGAGIVAPLIRSTDGVTFTTGCRLHPWTMTIDLPRRRPEFFTWACLMSKREVLEHVGLLDERYFMYWEDVEYGLRLSA